MSHPKPRSRQADAIRSQVLTGPAKARRRSQDAAEAILRGDISVPLRCGHCQTPSVVPDYEAGTSIDDSPSKPTNLRCLQCSRLTSIRSAHTVRKQEIQMIIQAGIDPRPNRRGS